MSIPASSTRRGAPPHARCRAVRCGGGGADAHALCGACPCTCRAAARVVDVHVRDGDVLVVHARRVDGVLHADVCAAPEPDVRGALGDGLARRGTAARSLVGVGETCRGWGAAHAAAPVGGWERLPGEAAVRRLSGAPPGRRPDSSGTKEGEKGSGRGGRPVPSVPQYPLSQRHAIRQEGQTRRYPSQSMSGQYPSALHGAGCAHSLWCGGNRTPGMTMGPPIAGSLGIRYAHAPCHGV